MINKLALGTVQFGSHYGINNNTGRPSVKTVYDILDYALDKGINMLDTACGYGDSELLIGQYLEKTGKNCSIISKPKDTSNYIEYMEKSFTRLKQNRIYGLLIHNFNFYKQNSKIYSTLKDYKVAGRVTKVGFSLYFPEELDYLLENKIEFDILQIPYSIFDQRFISYLPVLKSRNVEIHVRSVFLQGLFFKHPKNISRYFEKVKNRVSKIHALSNNHNIPVSAICLNFALLNKYIDKVIIGVDTTDDLKENIRALQYKTVVKELYNILSEMKETDINILIPFKWETV